MRDYHDDAVRAVNACPRCRNFDPVDRKRRVNEVLRDVLRTQSREPLTLPAHVRTWGD